MVRDLGIAKQRLAAVQTCLLTWAPHLHSPQCPTKHLPETVCGSLKPFLSPSLPLRAPPLQHQVTEPGSKEVPCLESCGVG